MDIPETWKEKGYACAPLPEGIDLATEIRRMAKEKNAVILAHYYTDGALQDIADFVGDSLALAQQAAGTDASTIVMCGVHFMAETCKILCPQKTVICPDTHATCSLAESCDAAEFAKFVQAHPGHKVISYVNTTAATKAWTDVVVTSSNARQIVESFPENQPLIFGPDRNLGAYINSVTGRNMLLWDGACHVHERFSTQKLLELKRLHPEAEVLVHPECKSAVAALADVIGSTAMLLRHAVNSPAQTFIVATESGILHKMRQMAPGKTFIPLPPDDSIDTDTAKIAAHPAGTAPGQDCARCCACNECNYMRMITLEKLYNSLRYLWPTVEVPEDIRLKAIKPIERMLEISARLGI